MGGEELDLPYASNLYLEGWVIKHSLWPFSWRLRFVSIQSDKLSLHKSQNIAPHKILPLDQNSSVCLSLVGHIEVIEVRSGESILKIFVPPDERTKWITVIALSIRQAKYKTSGSGAMHLPPEQVSSLSYREKLTCWSFVFKLNTKKVIAGTTNDRPERRCIHEESCPICFDSSAGAADSVLLQCGHSFCESCLLTAVHTSSLCPLCRQPIRI